MRDTVGRLRVLGTYLLRNTAKIRALSRAAKESNRILKLIILRGRLGDLVAAQIVLPRIAYGSYDVVWLAAPQYSGILEFNPAIKTVLAISSYAETILLRKIFCHEIWLDLEVDGALCSTFGMTVHNKNGAGIDMHNYLDFGSLTDVFSLIGCGEKASHKVQIYADPDFDAKRFLSTFFGASDRPILAFHSVSEESRKTWSNEQSQAFADWVLTNTKCNIIEFGLTPVLRAHCRIFQPKSSLTLGRQVALMAQTRIFIGVDSGFSHIANALNIRCLLLIGQLAPFADYLPQCLNAGDIIIRAQDSVKSIDSSEVTRHLALALGTAMA